MSSTMRRAERRGEVHASNARSAVSLLSKAVLTRLPVLAQRGVPLRNSDGMGWEYGARKTVGKTSSRESKMYALMKEFEKYSNILTQICGTQN